MLQYLEKLKQEDMDALIKKRETQKTILKDVARANDVRYLNPFNHSAFWFKKIIWF